MVLVHSVPLQGCSVQKTLSKVAIHRPSPFVCKATSRQECTSQRLHREAAALGVALAISCGFVSTPLPANADELRGTIAELVRDFRVYDKNSDGEVDVDELRSAFADATGVTVPRGVVKREIVPSIDFNSDGKVSTSEFLRALSLEAPLDDRMWAILDKNGDKAVDFPELVAGLGDLGGNPGLVMERIAFDQNDWNHDGRLNVDELASTLDWIATGVLGDINDDGSMG